MAVSDSPETEFTALARRFATRKITDIAELPDGSVVLRYASDTVPPQPDAPAMQDRLDQLTRKIDALTEDRLERERLSDRLAAVEFALLPAMSAEGSADIQPMGHSGDNLLHRALQACPAPDPALQALQLADDRILVRWQDAVAQMDLT